MARREVRWSVAAGSLIWLLALSACGGGGGTTTSAAPEVEPNQPVENEEVNRHLFLGDQYRSSDLPVKAAEEYEKALALDPENVDIYPRLGYVLVDAQDFERATQIYRRYVDMKPDDCNSHASLGYAYLAQDLNDEAIVAYEKAMQLCPDDANSFTNLGKAYLQGGQNVEAIEAFRQSIELNPSDLWTYEKLAELYYERKLYAEAIALYEAIIDNPENGKDAAWVSWASNRVASMYKWGGACSKAIPYYEVVVAADSSNVRAVRGLAGCLEDTQQTDRAIELYEVLIAQLPEESVYYYRLGELLNDVGRHSEAISRVKAGQEFDTTCGAHAYCVIGRAYEKKGGIANFKKAKREFTRALNCGDARFSDYASKQIERQDQLIKIEELKKQKEKYGY